MTSENESHSDDEGQAGSNSNQASASDGKNTVTKRRTKTGCLTCRRRRIKCGEERPTCKNCLKSKRECTGYNHPLIYKQHSQPQAEAASVSSAGSNHQWTHDHFSGGSAMEGRSRPPYHSTSGIQVLQERHFGTSTAWSASSNDATPDPAMVHATFAAGSHIEPDMSPWHQQSQNLASTNFAIRCVGEDEVVPASSLTTTGTTHHATGGSIFNTGDAHYSNLGFIQRPTMTGQLQSASEIEHLHNDAYRIAEDDDDPNDPWDVDMDEDLSNTQAIHNPSSLDRFIDTGSMPPEVASLVSHSRSSRELIPRLHPNSASPLLEERSRKIFKHFLTVTGPCMGLYDRHDLSVQSMPPKMAWTHDLPTIAFDSPALAHAILAVGAIHMFKLNIGNENTAIKHFMQALKRIGSAVGNPKQRLQVSTLATVLLLGYYEVMAGDHSRWNLHLSGAVKLVMEHNYAGMTRAIRQMRARLNSSFVQPQSHEHPTENADHPGLAAVSPKALDDNEWMVDQKLISKLTGYEVNYDTQVQPTFQKEHIIPEFDDKGLSEWRVIADLYWLYCRQDVFMSLLSGDPLLLPYPEWKYCPPRGPVNNPEHVNTTFDHLWLILARLADFGGKDRRRKQRVVEAHGGQWTPIPGFLDPASSMIQPSGSKPQPQIMDGLTRRPSANEGRARKAKGTERPTQQLGFYGMMPPATGPVHMPPSFSVMNAGLKGDSISSPRDSESSNDHDLDAETRYAVEEHAAITEAFDLFESKLGPDYQPLLSSDIQIATPFGPALQYRSHLIATMWTFYIMGRILLRRMHPHSPPAALVSAGVNARVTHEYAQSIGRICGGIIAQHNYLLQTGHTDYVLSGAVMEVTFPLLFAAVQYHDPVQRGWTISKLGEIAQVTGWQTSAAVAAACESMWERAGLMGRGPPYHRTMDRNHIDQRLNGTYKFGQAQSPPTSRSNPAEEHESRFVSHDRGLIDKYASTRAHWALGLLSVEEDLQHMSLKKP